MYNPYGAVPDALKETRLTLRDIMSDMLATKAQRGRLELEKTKAETETAMVAANIERDRLSHLRDIARMDQARQLHDDDAARQTAQFDKTFSLSKAAEKRATDEAAERKRQFDENLTLAKSADDRAKSAEERAAAEEARKNEVKTAGEWVQAAGMSPGMLEFLGVDQGTQIKRQDAQELYKTMQTAFQKNPALGLMAHGYNLRGVLGMMQDKLRDPNLTQEERATIRQKYDSTLQKFENLDQLIMASKVPDQAKIVETARRTWSDDPTIQTKYESFDAFLQEFQSDVAKARGVFHDDIKKLREFKPALPKEKMAENKKAVMEGLNELESLKPTNIDLDIIRARIKETLQQGDTEAALAITNRSIEIAKKAPGATPDTKTANAPGTAKELSGATRDFTPQPETSPPAAPFDNIRKVAEAAVTAKKGVAANQAANLAAIAPLTANREDEKKRKPLWKTVEESYPGSPALRQLAR